MPRIIVTTDPVDKNEPPVLLDERVNSLHLCDDHAAEQLIERLAWAVSDAEDTQRSLLHRAMSDDPAMGGSRERGPPRGPRARPSPMSGPGALAPPPHREALHGRGDGAHARADLESLVLLGPAGAPRRAGGAHRPAATSFHPRRLLGKALERRQLSHNHVDDPFRALHAPPRQQQRLGPRQLAVAFVDRLSRSG